MSFSASDIDRTREACHQVLTQHELPGLALAVVHDGRLVYGEGFGWADIAKRRELTLSSRQRIGSITKTMTALCIMAQVDAGGLRLDTPIVDLLPEVRFIGEGQAEALTIEHLLTHTSGIGEAPTRAHLQDPESELWSESPDLLPAAERYPDGIEIEVDPGTKWAYANHGYGLLGDILVRLESAPLAQILRDRVLRPLGMRDSDIRDRPHHSLASGYHRALSADERAARGNVELWASDEPPQDAVNIKGGYVYIPIPAAGSVQSTARDMARYAVALLDQGAGIVDAASFAAMVAPQWEPHPRLTSLGLSFMRQKRFGIASFGHGGGVVGGWNTELALFPERDLGVAIHFNLDNEVTTAARSTIIQAVLDATVEPLPGIAPDAGIVAGAPGEYEAAPGDLTNTRIRQSTGRISIEEAEGGLRLRSRRGSYAEGVALRPADADEPERFQIDDGAVEPLHVVFTRDERGRVDGLLMDRCVRMQRSADFGQV